MAKDKFKVTSEEIEGKRIYTLSSTKTGQVITKSDNPSWIRFIACAADDNPDY